MITDYSLQGFFPVDPVKRSITGHSMGGHGAMIAHLKNPGMYSSVSAFSPIVNPSAVPWGEKVTFTIRRDAKSSSSHFSGFHWISGLC